MGLATPPEVCSVAWNAEVRMHRRSPTRFLALAALGLAGCDISVKTFAGTAIVMTLNTSQLTEPGQHLEMWARDQYGDIIRISPLAADVPGMRIVRAVSMADPCMIDGNGNLLTTAAAYPTTVNYAGVMQSPDQQAAIIRNRIAQVTATDNCDANQNCGTQVPCHLPNCAASSLAQPGDALVMVPEDETPLNVAPNASPSDRLAACQAYWMSPQAYTPNPAQLTTAAHGTVYGFLTYTTQTPVQSYDMIRLDTRVNLRGIQELFFTLESSTVDPNNRGPLYIQGIAGPPQLAGNDVLQFNLHGVGTKLSGTAALYVNLDQNGSQF
jgi:hypothetical protein